MKKEFAEITCLKCDPKGNDPDIVSGYKDSLKYLVSCFHCKKCDTNLTYLNSVEKC